MTIKKMKINEDVLKKLLEL